MKKLLLAAVLLSICPMGWAQTSTGTITGNVLDASGASVPDAQVTATNLGTNRVTTVPSTGAGTYTIPGLIPGTYRVEVTLDGFKTFRQEPVTVFTASTTTLHVSMEVGAVTETIEVLSQATPLNLEGNEMSAAIEQRALFDLPLQISGLNSGGGTGRRVLDAFIMLTPGVTGNQFNKSINGSQNLSTDTIIDGISWQINVVPGLIATFGPPFESIEEFKVQTANFNAEYSRGLGVTNFTMKSGANQFHGNVFEFIRNDKLEANTFFGNSTGTPRAIVRQNEWGASLGGPIIKDKTFFYFAYTGFKRRGGASQTSVVTVPTARMKQGDFSELLDTNLTGADSPILIHDANGVPYLGNVIPAGDLSSVALQAANLLPNPDLSGRLTNNFLARSSQPVDDWDWSIKIDHNISGRQKIAYSMWIQENVRTQNGAMPGPLDNGFINDEAGRGLRLNHDFFISPTLVHHVGIGYGRRRSDFFPPDAAVGFDNAAFYQIPNVTSGPGLGVPSMRVDGYQAFGGNWDITLERGNTYNFVDNLTWIKGKHTIKTGVDFRNYQYNVNYCLQCQGVFKFDSRATSSAALSDPNFAGLGHAFASFMTGQVAEMRQERGVNPRGMRNGYYAAYIQDSFKVTPKLTMNIGVRFEVPVPLAESYDRLSSLDFNLANPAAGGIPGALAFAGSGSGRTGSRRFAKTEMDVAPRLGLAYQLNEKTVLRAGYGIYYSQTNGNAADGNVVGAVGSGHFFVFFDETPDAGLTGAFDLDRGPAPVVLNLPDLDPSLQNGSQIDYINSNSHKTAQAHSWNLSVQRELPGNIMIDAAYVGQKGVNLAAGLETINQVPMSFLSSTNNPLFTLDITDPAVVAAGFTAPFSGFSGTLAQALRPFPQYLNVNHFQEPTGGNSYHGFQLKVQKRFSQGLQFLISYTGSKTLSNAGGNAFSSGQARPPFTEQRGLEWAIGPNDISQNLVVSSVYELPFGPGKRFANTGGAAGKIIGGWQVAGIARYFAGTPLGIGGGPALPLFGGSNRPNRVSGVPVVNSNSNFDPATDLYLNINAFSQPSAFTRGNLGPRISDARRFATYQEDITLFKFIQFTESIKLEFRAEFFNLFNRVIFGGPSTNSNDPTSFGTIGSTSIPPRQVQMALKLHF